VSGLSVAGLMWAGGGADRARGEFVESVAAGFDSSVVPALEDSRGHQWCGNGRGWLNGGHEEGFL
jgi:hypothetical protein